MKQEERDKRFTEEGIFTYNSEGFSIVINGVNSIVKWSDIVRLSAYKADLITIDEICMENEVVKEVFATNLTTVYGRN